MQNSKWKSLAHKIVIIIIVLWTIVPLYWLFVMSVTPQVHLAGRADPAMTPTDTSFDSFRELLNPGPEAAGPTELFRRALLNSTIVASISTILGLILGSLAAYALQKMKFPGREASTIIILGSRMIPPIALAIPLFAVFQQLGLLDRYTPLILVYTALSMAWTTLLMSNYFSMLPENLVNAARVDGCTRLQAFYKVILPLSLPGIISVTVITFLFSWGEFLFALLFTSTASARTVPVAVSMFIGEFGVEYNMIAAALLLTILPPVILTLVFQRFIVSGLTAGAVKG